MTVAMTATVTVAYTGVLNRSDVRPNVAGSTPSRPIANKVRAPAVAQATDTTKAEHIPPISTSVPSQLPTDVLAVVFSATGSAPTFAPLPTPKPIVIEYVVHI